MSTLESKTNPSSKTRLITIIFLVTLCISPIIYILEFSKAKSWSVKYLAECTMNLSDKKMASEILNQVSENPLSGKVDRLSTKCNSILEKEKMVEANALVVSAKATVSSE